MNKAARASPGSEAVEIAMLIKTTWPDRWEIIAPTGPGTKPLEAH
jgi:hypothetical protein